MMLWVGQIEKERTKRRTKREREERGGEERRGRVFTLKTRKGK